MKIEFYKAKLGMVSLSQVRSDQVRIGQGLTHPIRYAISDKVRLGLVILGKDRIGQVRLGKDMIGQERKGYAMLGQVKLDQLNKVSLNLGNFANIIVNNLFSGKLQSKLTPSFLTKYIFPIKWFFVPFDVSDWYHLAFYFVLDWKNMILECFQVVFVKYCIGDLTLIIVARRHYQKPILLSQEYVVILYCV